MEYAYIFFGFIFYVFVAIREWGAAEEENSKSPFIHAAFWPIWLVIYLVIIGGMAAIAVFCVFGLLFSEIYKALRWSKSEEA